MTSILLLLLSLSAPARAVPRSDGVVAEPAFGAEADKILPTTLACLTLSDEECAAASNAKPFVTGPGRMAAPAFGLEPAFGKLWSEYPRGSVDDVKGLIGRGGEGWIVNTCAIRLTYALDGAGFAVDDSVQDARSSADPRFKINYISDRSGVRGARKYIYRVDELARYLVKAYGKPPVAATKGAAGSEAALRAAVKGRKGVILFVVNNFSDATGHFDLWDGGKPADEEYFARADDVFLWP